MIIHAHLSLSGQSNCINRLDSTCRHVYTSSFGQTHGIPCRSLLTWPMTPLPKRYSKTSSSAIALKRLGASKPADSLMNEHVEVSIHGGSQVARYGWVISWKIHQWMIWGHPHFWKPPFAWTQNVLTNGWQKCPKHDFIIQISSSTRIFATFWNRNQNWIQLSVQCTWEEHPRFHF